MKFPVPRVLGSWGSDPLWGRFYDWTVEHRYVGGLAWWVGIQSDLGRLYAATTEISEQPAGARILDVPCGGGVALRGLRSAQDVDYVAADLDPRMLERTMAAARERGVDHLVTPQVADVADLPFEDDSFDLVVSFTGLHCFPDPEAAVLEMVRVLKPGGVILGSALLNDSGRRFEPIRAGGRIAGLLGPGCTGDDVVLWLGRNEIADITLGYSGGIGYFRGVKGA